MRSFFNAARKWVGKVKKVVYGKALWHIQTVEMEADAEKERDGTWRFRVEVVDGMKMAVVEVHE